MTADEMARPAHLPTLTPIGRTSVVVRLCPPESTLAATATAGLLDPQPEALRRILRAIPRVMACLTACAATSGRGTLDCLRDEDGEADGTSGQQERRPRELLLHRHDLCGQRVQY